MKCPRCQEKLATDEPGIRHCAECAGIWVDGAQVAESYPALRFHASRIDELLDAGAKRGTGIAACPQCGSRPLEFPFLHVWLDLCTECYGVWLDGPEVAVVGAADADVDGVPDPAPGGAGYREAAPPQRRIECMACHGEVHPSRTLITSEGAVCDDCVAADRAAEQLRDPPALRSLRTGLGAVLRVIGQMFDADGRRIYRWPR